MEILKRSMTEYKQLHELSRGMLVVLMGVVLFLGLTMVNPSKTQAYAASDEPTMVNATLDEASGVLTVVPDEAGVDIVAALTNYKDNTKVNQIILQGSIVAPSVMTDAFRDFRNVTEIVGLQNLDTSAVDYMGGMFASCVSLTALDLSTFDTSNVKDMGLMFAWCESLSSLDVSNFNTSAVTNMTSMFLHCHTLAALDLSSFDTSAVTSMSFMFNSCRSLSAFDISNFNTASVTVAEQMFDTTVNLTYIKAGLLTENIISQIPVKSNAQGVAQWNNAGVAVSQIKPNEKATYIATADTGFSYVGLSASLTGYPMTMVVENNTLIDSASIPLPEGRILEGLYKDATFTLDTRWNLVIDTVNAPVELFVNTVEVFTVNFVSNGGSEVAPVTLAKNQVLPVPSEPTRAGYKFDGWYSDEALTVPYVFSDPVVSSMTLYAKWEYLGTMVSATLDAPSGQLTVTPDDAGDDLKTALNAFKNNPDVVKIAIQGNIVTPGDMSAAFSNFVKVTEISGLENLDTRETVSMSHMFSQCFALASLDLSSSNVSKVTDMSGMFASCTALTTLNLSNLDTSATVNMSSMFLGCTLLPSLDLSSFDTSSVTNMSHMFEQCSSLSSLNLSSFNTSKVTDMNSMFFYCPSIVSLDVSNFDTSSVVDMRAMFQNCTALTSLNLSNFDTRSATNLINMFAYCASLSSLDLSGFDTNTAINVSAMFNESKVLTYVKTGLLSENVATQILAKQNDEGISEWNRDGLPVDSIAPNEKATYIATANADSCYVQLHADLIGYPTTIVVANGALIDPAIIPLPDGYALEGLYRNADLSAESRWNLEVDTVTAPLELYVSASSDAATVSFESNGGSVVSPVTVVNGRTIKQPADPVRNNYHFAGWYSDEALSVSYSFSTPVISDIVLYAKWEEQVLPPEPTPAPVPGEGGGSSSSQADSSKASTPKTGDNVTLAFWLLGAALGMVFLALGGARLFLQRSK